MSRHVMPIWSCTYVHDLRDYYLRYLQNPLSLSLFLFGLILFFWLVSLICPVLSLAPLQHLLLPFLSPSGACHESSFFLRSRLVYIQSLALLRLPVISHWSFILFHVSDSFHVQQCLLTINKTRGCYTRPSIFFCSCFRRFNLLIFNHCAPHDPE